MKTKKKVSKKLKKSWRKHIDDTDVDQFFENERLNERLGKSFESRDDAEIFTIQKKPENLIRDSILCPKKQDQKELSLKCYRSLENTSAVPDPLVKRNTVRTKEQRQHPILKKKNEIRLHKGILKKKEISQLQRYFQKRVSCLEQKQRRRIAVDKNIWGEEDDQSKLSKVKPWLANNTFLHTVRNTSNLPRKSKKRISDAETIIPSFEAPHPGTSYNPSFPDHLQLANEIAKTELNVEKQEKHLDRVTHNMFKPINAVQNEKNWLQEMSEGLPLRAHKNVEESDDSDDSQYMAINAPVARAKKTIKQRKKQARLKQEELRRKEVKEQKKKSQDICKVKNIMKEIEKEELRRDKRSLKRLQKTNKKVERPQRVGKNRFEPEEAPISRITDLTGSLREIIPQGNILKDKLMNLQKRSFIEVTRPQFKSKKKRMKKYRSNSHRTQPLEFRPNELIKNLKRKKK